MGTSIAGNDSSVLRPWYSDGNLYGIVASDTTGFSAASTAASGFWAVSREGVAVNTVYKNGTVFATDTTADGLASLSGSSVSIALLAVNDTSAGFRRGSANQMAFASIGGLLTAVDVTNLYNALNTYHALLPFGPDSSGGGGGGLLLFGGSIMCGWTPAPLLGAAAAWKAGQAIRRNATLSRRALIGKR